MLGAVQGMRRQAVVRLALPAIACWALAACALACASTGSGRRPSAADYTLPRLDDGATFADPKLTALLDARTHSYERAGNQVALLVNGKEAFARRFENAADADVLLVKTFIITDDEVGRRVAALLSERARAGAYVVLQYDVKGSIGGTGDVQQMLANATADRPVGEKNLIRELREAGVIIVPANSPSRGIEAEEWGQNVDRLRRDPAGAIERSWQTLVLLDHADHEKYWITGHRGADGQLTLAAILGGMNLASEYAYGGTGSVDAGSKRGGWRDTDVEVRGPVVNDVVDRFFDVMDYHLGVAADYAARAPWNPVQPAAGTARCRFVYNQPLVRNARSIEALYRTLIDATPRGSIVRLETAYYSPGRALRKALRAALRRGVRTAVITNSDETNDIKVVAFASRFAFYALLQFEPTVALFERVPRPDLGEGTLHSKVASFGVRGPVIVGSANLDAQSSEHNTESVLLIYDDALRQRFDAMYDQDMASDRATRITREVIYRDSAWERVRQWSLYAVLWYWL